MEILYKDCFGTFITARQAANDGNYDKLYKPAVAGLIKKIENYAAGELVTIYYYKEADETVNEIINKLLPYECGFGIIERETYGLYLIEKTEHYSGGKFVGKTRDLYDSTGLHIASEETDPVTNLPDYELTTKHLGEYIHEEDSGCIFYYNSDGSFSYCEDNYASYQDMEIFDETTVHSIKHKYMLSDAMYSFYLTAEFLPPI